MKRLAAISVLLAVGGSSGCSGMRSFRVRSDPPPAPAARPDDQGRLEAPEMPFALAREDDYVVRVVVSSTSCSGTLIDEDQVLTAHHCVAQRDKYGDFVEKNARARDIRVELGGDNLPWGDVGVRHVVAPACGHAAGEGDIAILVLERKLIGVATAKPRLDDAPVVGEHVNPVGFGRCALSSEAISRRHRPGGRVDRLLDSRFRLDAGICPGDSGGPVMSEGTGEVVGVISQAVMDGSEATRGRAEFTRLDRWRAVFATAKAIAEGQSASELPPIGGCPPR
ncbi:MAG: S1 family peptidase [Myxococcales bacterium]|nr:S1 family peptidase [Myxococcales bacterium]